MRIGADGHAGLGKHICVGKEVARTVLHATASVVVGKLRLNGNILGAGLLALPSNVTGPCAWRAGVSAVVANGGCDGTGIDTGVCGVISKCIRQGRTQLHTSIGRVICILTSLSITVGNTSMQLTVSILQLRAIEHTETTAVLREEVTVTEADASAGVLIAESVDGV